MTEEIEPTEALFGQCSAYKTRQLARKVNAHYDTYMAQCGLKMTQFALLGFVGRFGPLITQGWLVMGEGVNARSRLLALTPEGTSLCKRAYKRWQQAQADLRLQVGVQEVAALHVLIGQTLKKMS
jgi:hypothetical protein